MANHSIAIIRGKGYYPVFAAKWPLKLHFQFCIAFFVVNRSNTFCRFGLPIFNAAVYYAYFSIIAQTVFGSDIGTSILIGLAKFSNLVPFAKVLFQLNMAHGFQGLISGSQGKGG